MQDRNVEFPQRYRLQKVDGTDDIFDLIPAPGEVSYEGTLINKNTLLKDATAALFGLGSGAVPNDVLNVLSRFQSGMGNEHIWKRTANEYKAEKTTNPGITSLNVSGTVYTSDAVSAEGAKVVLVNPTATTISSANGAQANTDALKWKYFNTSTDATVYYCYHVPTGSVSNNAIQVSTYTVELVPVGAVDYVNSPNANAYPPAVDDGYTYEYLGLVGGGRLEIVTGTYKATGSKQTINLGFRPKLVIIYNQVNNIVDNSDSLDIGSNTASVARMGAIILSDAYIANTRYALTDTGFYATTQTNYPNIKYVAFK